jgi:tetratricopeptide (TPR) repeat protein
MRNVAVKLLAVILLAAAAAPAGHALAETKRIEAEHLYLMGDNDSRNEARRICIQEAKRRALESAGTYVASLTQVKEFRLTRDEVTSYTAGVVETEVVSEEMRGTAQRPEIFIKVRCVIDTAVMLEQLRNFRENDDLKAQLDAVVRENEALKTERDALLAGMRAEKDKGKAEELRKQIGAVLSREEANDETMKYWKRLAHRVADPDQPVDDAEFAEATAALGRIAKEDPKNGRARFLLASIHQRSKNFAAAEQEIRGALEHSPDDPFLRLKLGVLMKEGRNFNAALRELLIAQKGLGDHPSVLFHLSRTYFFLDNCDQATDHARQFLQRIKRGDKPVNEKMRIRALQTVRKCERGELDLPRRSR